MKTEILHLIIGIILIAQSFAAGMYFTDRVYANDKLSKKIPEIGITIFIFLLGIPGLLIILPTAILAHIGIKLNRWFAMTFFIKHGVLKRPIPDFDEEFYKAYKKKYESQIIKWYQIAKIIDGKVIKYIANNLDQIKGK